MKRTAAMFKVAIDKGHRFGAGNGYRVRTHSHSNWRQMLSHVPIELLCVRNDGYKLHVVFNFQMKQTFMESKGLRPWNIGVAGWKHS